MHVADDGYATDSGRDMKQSKPSMGRVALRWI